MAKKSCSSGSCKTPEDCAPKVVGIANGKILESRQSHSNPLPDATVRMRQAFDALLVECPSVNGRDWSLEILMNGDSSLASVPLANRRVPMDKQLREIVKAAIDANTADARDKCIAYLESLEEMDSIDDLAAKYRKGLSSKTDLDEISAEALPHPTRT